MRISWIVVDRTVWRRLTGIKSAIGRILDGFAGDIWFACIYVAFALRLSHEYGTHWFFALAVPFRHVAFDAGEYHGLLQNTSSVFISKDKGAEFQSIGAGTCPAQGDEVWHQQIFLLLISGGYTLLQGESNSLFAADVWPVCMLAMGMIFRRIFGYVSGSRVKS